MSHLVTPRTQKDTRQDPRHRPMRVTAHLAAPLVWYGDPLHLDGPLAAAAFRQAVHDTKGALDLPALEGPWAEDFRLPLAVWTAPPPPPAVALHPNLFGADGLLWGWCCSAAVAVAAHHGKREVRKRAVVDEAILWSRDKSLEINGGPYKPWDLAFPAVAAPSVTWYALGDPDAVRLLLPWVTHLGKRHNHGNGRILRWEVEEEGQDRSLHHDGRTTRVLPSTLCPCAPHVLDALRAPYHHRSRKLPCAPVGSQVHA